MIKLRTAAPTVDENATPALRPFLGQHESRFNGLSQTNLIRKQRALRQRGLECEESGIDLVGIQIDLCIRERRRELLDAIGRAAARELVGEVLGVVVGKFQSVRLRPAAHPAIE